MRQSAKFSHSAFLERSGHISPTSRPQERGGRRSGANIGCGFTGELQYRLTIRYGYDPQTAAIKIPLAVFRQRESLCPTDISPKRHSRSSTVSGNSNWKMSVNKH
jgi:hypothetical protein